MPISTLGDERFGYDDKAQALVGEHTGTRFAIGMILKLRLAEANPLTGALKFEPVDLAAGASGIERRGQHLAERKGEGPRRAGAHLVGRRGRPGNIRHQGRGKR